MGLILCEASRGIRNTRNDIETRYFERRKATREEREKRPKFFSPEWVDALGKEEISATFDEAVKNADVGGCPLMTLMVPDQYPKEQRNPVIGRGYFIEHYWEGSPCSEAITRLLTEAGGNYRARSF